MRKQRNDFIFKQIPNNINSAWFFICRMIQEVEVPPHDPRTNEQRTLNTNFHTVQWQPPDQGWM